MLNNVIIVHEILYCHSIMNLLAFHADKNVIKRKHEPSKIQREEINLINRLKYAEHKIFCICVDVNKINEGDDFDKIYEVLSTLKNRKLKINNIFTEKFNDMLKNPNFEQDYLSRTAIGIYKTGQDSIRLMKCLIYHDRFDYDNMNFFDLMGSICKYLNEISKP